MTSATITPLTSLHTETHFIPPHEPSRLPNSAATGGKPLLIYRAAFIFTSPLPSQEDSGNAAGAPSASTPSPRASTTTTPSRASLIEQHLQKVGVVAPSWRYGMYSTTHFHSTTHEVLCVSSGRARLLFGGEENPGRVEVVVERGDVMVVPAGVAHRLLEDLSVLSGLESAEFEMVGAYPVGNSEEWDMCYGREGEEGKVEGIKGLGWFERDPVYGEEGPVLEV